ncbi:hypothetical protein AB4Y36_38015 [Paraburkholderia sp. BR10936]|uniref:hypothetical protein n=1 Tax=Paraburkholderia sp. BR10936 TaxID=3236993 RepID=UPI0034D2D6EA
MKLRYLVLPLALVACESMPGHEENARAALSAFCRLHKAEIFHVLLTPKQVEAGNVVCASIGLPLGAEPD